MANEVKFETGIDLRSQKGVNAADPSAGTDLVNLQTLQAYIRGITSVKDAVRVATTTALSLATDFENGDIIDGVTLATGDRVLDKNNATAADRGIYVVQATGAAVRATDFDASAEVKDGATMAVGEGTTNGGHVFMLTTNNPITLGSTGLTFVDFGQGTIYTAGNGLTGTTTFTVLADGGTITVGALGIKVTPGVVSRIYSTATHASSTSIAITHGLNTLALTGKVTVVATGERIFPGEVIGSGTDNPNTATYTFGNAPSANTLRFTLEG